MRSLRHHRSGLARSIALALGSAACLVVALLAYRAQVLTALLIPFMAVAGLAGVLVRTTEERFRSEFLRELLAGRVGVGERVHVAVRCAFWLVLSWFIQLAFPRAPVDASRYWLYIVVLPGFVAITRIVVCELRPARPARARG